MDGAHPIQIISNNALSKTATTSTGVLQGGTLAPLQFTYYINTLLDKPLPGTYSIFAYADDLAFLCVADTITQLANKSQRALNILLSRLEQLHCTVSLNIQNSSLLTANYLIYSIRITV
jgi:hypothetical protein